MGEIHWEDNKRKSRRETSMRQTEIIMKEMCKMYDIVKVTENAEESGARSDSSYV